MINRRKFIQSTTAAGIAAVANPGITWAATPKVISKPIPSSGELMPVLGMGTWITFNVGTDAVNRKARCEVLQSFFNAGGGMVDSSPMYGSSEEVIGHCLKQLGTNSTLFSATKVWTPFMSMGKSQIADSHTLWGIDRFDLLQIHNLVGWEKHLETLIEMKVNKQVRYIGITTSHGRRHRALELIMENQNIDFVQLTYNILDRKVEQRLLPLARERGLAVIANRPFKRGELFDKFQHHPLPEWADEFDCKNWAQFFLKFIISHPAINCAIPATSQVAHMNQNMGAGLGNLPDPATRKRMIAYIKRL